MADFRGPASAGETPAGQQMLPPGFRLVNPSSGNSYQILRTLGQGGFGITYEGVSLQGNRRVAIKEFFPVSFAMRSSHYAVVITGEESAFRTMLNSFYKEARVLYELRGVESVVKIYDYFYANNTAYNVMEFIPGETLLRYIGKHGLLDPAAFQPQLRKLMMDLSQLHERQIIHRDISPDNIMVTEDGSLKLIDFGSARAYAATNKLTVNVKRNFAPMEQYSVKGQGAFTDVYSLAATIYYSFTGKLVDDAFTRLKHDNLIRPTALGVKLTAQQEEALIKALAVKPADRYQTMGEFAQAYFLPAPMPKKTETPAAGSESGLRSSLATIAREPLLPILSGLLLAFAIIIEVLA